MKHPTIDELKDYFEYVNRVDLPNVDRDMAIKLGESCGISNIGNELGLHAVLLGADAFTSVLWTGFYMGLEFSQRQQDLSELKAYETTQK